MWRMTNLPTAASNKRIVCKRKIVLRTHSGMPVAPEWSSNHTVYIRASADGKIRSASLGNYHLSGWRWSLLGLEYTIIAVEWLP